MEYLEIQCIFIIWFHTDNIGELKAVLCTVVAMSIAKIYFVLIY